MSRCWRPISENWILCTPLAPPQTQLYKEQQGAASRAVEAVSGLRRSGRRQVRSRRLGSADDTSPAPDGDDDGERDEDEEAYTRGLAARWRGHGAGCFCASRSACMHAQGVAGASRSFFRSF